MHEVEALSQSQSQMDLQDFKTPVRQNSLRDIIFVMDEVNEPATQHHNLSLTQLNNTEESKDNLGLSMKHKKMGQVVSQ